MKLCVIGLLFLTSGCSYYDDKNKSAPASHNSEPKGQTEIKIELENLCDKLRRHPEDYSETERDTCSRTPVL